MVARVGEVDLLVVELEAKLQQIGVDPDGATPERRAEALELLIDDELCCKRPWKKTCCAATEVLGMR